MEKAEQELTGNQGVSAGQARRATKQPKKSKKRIFAYIGVGVTVLIVSVIIHAIFTNPFYNLTTVKTTYRARFEGDNIVTSNQFDKVSVCDNPICNSDGFVKSGLYMINSRYFSSPRSKSTSVEGIAADIHNLRFNPQNPYIISGDHFTPFYNRSLGIFYYSALDPTIVTSEQDWRNRELSYLQTLALALSVYDKTDELSTTIVPMGEYTYTPINVYSYPSDTMYSLLYAGAVLSGVEPAYSPTNAQAAYNLHTKDAAKDLLAKFDPSLKRHLKEYQDRVYDNNTGLIRHDIHLSGTKDITKRENAFYDNVIYWRTMQLADKLGLIKIDDTFLANYKKRIIDTFWLEDKGYFLEDQSQAAKDNKYYSSDWLIVLSTRFLDPTNEQERRYFEEPIQHIMETGIAQPFGVKYQNDRRSSRQFAPLRVFGTTSYGGDSIWSFWGLEYTKTLLSLYQQTGNPALLTEADRNIAAYKNKMIQYGGFPELYDANGNLYETAVYRSVRQTGWVIGFEQVLAQRVAIIEK